MPQALKILIVEDEYLFALDLKMQLGRMGYTICDLVASGEKAIEAVQKYAPDVVLMDMTLAGQLSGFEAASAILASQKTQVIFMTGHNDDETIDQLKQLNPLAILTKPITARAVHNSMSSGQ